MKNYGVGKVQALNNGETIAIKVGASYFDIATDGEVNGEIEVTLDSTPGAIEGTGTSTDPFVIMSIEDLVLFSKKVSEGKSYSGEYVELGKTLDFNSDLSYIDPNTTDYDTYLGGDGTKGLKEQLTNGLGFRPIGETTSKYFKGNFNGKNNTIKNIKIDVEDYAGLFAIIGDVNRIYNLGMEGTINSTGKNAGGIIGYAFGKVNISNCYAKGNITSATDSAGGIVGTTWGASLQIDSCQNFATISANHWGAGGIIGKLASSGAVVKNSSNFGTVINPKGQTHHGAGGIVGCNYSTATLTIENCCDAGKLKTLFAQTSNENFFGVGGMVGYINKANTLIRNSVHFSELEAEILNLGGIIGRAQDISTVTTDLKKCYYKNDIIKKSVGSGITEELATGKTEIQIKSKAFVEELNQNIEDGCPYEQEDDGTTKTITIDTTGWAKWVYNSGGYPTLDTSTIWNGTSWVTK